MEQHLVAEPVDPAAIEAVVTVTITVIITVTEVDWFIQKMNKPAYICICMNDNRIKSSKLILIRHT